VPGVTPEQALVSELAAPSLAKTAGDPKIQGGVETTLMIGFRDQHRLDDAIFFGMEAVSGYQQIRKNISDTVHTAASDAAAKIEPLKFTAAYALPMLFKVRASPPSSLTSRQMAIAWLKYSKASCPFPMAVSADITSRRRMQAGFAHPRQDGGTIARLLNQAQGFEFLLQLCSIDWLHQVGIAPAQQCPGDAARVGMDSCYDDFGGL
jgi:hypothetical protein